MTVMGCVPTASVEMSKVAVAGLPLSGPVPMETPLSRNVTVPVAGDVAGRDRHREGDRGAVGRWILTGDDGNRRGRLHILAQDRRDAALQLRVCAGLELRGDGVHAVVSIEVV